MKNNDRAEYHPAKGVGGDFYDYFVIDKSHVGVVIADVSGKGDIDSFIGGIDQFDDITIMAMKIT